MKKLLFKTINYIMFFVFILSACGLDSEMFLTPFFSTILSGTYLFIAYKVWEAKQLRSEK